MLRTFPVAQSGVPQASFTDKISSTMRVRKWRMSQQHGESIIFAFRLYVSLGNRLVENKTVSQQA